MTKLQPKHSSIAISGIRGSFSEEAAQVFLSKEGLHADIVYATTARQAFASVTESQTALGLVPLENPTAESLSKQFMLLPIFFTALKKFSRLMSNRTSSLFQELRPDR
jgi:prephenate dehydratase